MSMTQHTQKPWRRIDPFALSLAVWVIPGKLAFADVMFQERGSYREGFSFGSRVLRGGVSAPGEAARLE